MPVILSPLTSLKEKCKQCKPKFFFQALDGFVIVLTRDFEVFYASETVQDYLGLAQVTFVSVYNQHAWL